jgi:hypothetical protein
MTDEQAEALTLAKAWAANRPEVSTVELGFRYRNNVKLDDVVIVVTLVVKRAAHTVEDADLVPVEFGALKSDVQEGHIQSYDSMFPIQNLPQSNTAKHRPFLCGDSIGHPTITAGTAGVPVKIDGSSAWHVVTNAHVGAPHWDAPVLVGDLIYQPGKHDGGTSSARVGLLRYWVEIGPPSAPPPKKRAAMVFWKTFKNVPNGIVESLNALGVTDCPYRLRLETVGMQAATQPNPHRVDLAVFEPIDGIFTPEVRNLGPVTGIRDFSLGNAAQKYGRTTDYTRGECESVGAMIRVSYGSFTAEFDNQVGFRGTSGDFSAGGDSGSGIYHTDMTWGALLFAGGGGKTYGNTVSDCLAYGPPGLRIA